MEAVINIAYLAASLCFILGIKGLAHPRTAVRGNLIGGLGMLLAIVATLFDRHLLAADARSWMVLGAGLLVGSAIGWLLAVRVAMTAMPQMVALLNGFGGGASTLVAGAALIDVVQPNAQFTVSTGASGLIGAVTFWGSLVAFDKLQGVVLSEKPLHLRNHNAINVGLGLGAFVFGAWIVYDPTAHWAYWVVVVFSSILGVTLTIPIGGADMPVAIALLNSYSGLAGAATGFVLNNNVLVIAGSLVGASGIILTQIMCRAMNRSLTSVLTGAIGPTGTTASADEVYTGRVKSASAEEIAMLFDAARKVVIVPGYGLAVSQAQHAVRELSHLLEARGIDVEFAIHPVAGRMPGHMNVLLAEADVPYDKLKEMDEVNPAFEQTDVVLVIGANDVVNPLARTDPQSPIAGMPILNVDKAKTVVVVKRSLSPGFAGIPNPLFAATNCLMYFQDGKKAVNDLIAAIKEAA